MNVFHNDRPNLARTIQAIPSDRLAGDVRIIIEGTFSHKNPKYGHMGSLSMTPEDALAFAAEVTDLANAAIKARSKPHFDDIFGHLPIGTQFYIEEYAEATGNKRIKIGPRSWAFVQSANRTAFAGGVYSLDDTAKPFRNTWTLRRA